MRAAKVGDRGRLIARVGVRILIMLDGGDEVVSLDLEKNRTAEQVMGLEGEVVVVRHDSWGWILQPLTDNGRLNLLVGEEYYSIAGSLESADYSEYSRADQVKPWLGKLSTITGTLFLHRFNRETGAINQDHNAMALVGYEGRPRDLFATLEAANKAYFCALLTKARNKLNGFEEILAEIQEIAADELVNSAELV